MADVTFRLAWDNAAKAAAAAVVASSEQAAYPAAAVKRAGLAQGWRSKVGWTVVAGFNDKLDFLDNGVARVATLTAGTYATGDALRDEVATRMNAVAVTNTYALSYNSGGSQKFVIARATGAGTLGLPWLTGANTSRSVGADLGFVVSADDSGDVSYTADTVSYQSRQYLTADLGSAVAIASGHLIRTQTFGTGGSATLSGNATDAWTAPSQSGAMTLGNNLAALWFSSASYRYWRVVINDVQNSDGFVSARGLWLAPHLELSRQVAIGYQRTSSDGSTAVPTYGGGLIQAKRVAPKTLSLPFKRLRRDEQEALIAINEAVGIGAGMIVAIDPQNYPTNSLFMALRAPIVLDHSIGDGTPPERWTGQLEFIEVRA